LLQSFFSPRTIKTVCFNRLESFYEKIIELAQMVEIFAVSLMRFSGEAERKRAASFLS